MAPNFDSEDVSSLLCAEADSVFVYDGNNEEMNFYNNHRNDSQIRIFYGGNAKESQNDEILSSLIAKESLHLPSNSYLNKLRNRDLDLVGRIQAVDWICKVRAHFGFGPLCAYLSISYMDRFLSSYNFPKEKAWTMQLLAVACLSLGAKMEETEIPLSIDLQVGEIKFVFEARTIQRMELLVLSTLKWRMQSITPFSFLESFLSKVTGDLQLHGITILRSIQLISSTVFGIDFLEFKPSEIAAAAVIVSSSEDTPTILESGKAVAALSQYVKKERLLKCMELIRDSANGGIGPSSLSFLPASPIGVLEAACLSFKTDGSNLTSSSNISSSRTVIKRRRLDTDCESQSKFR